MLHQRNALAALTAALITLSLTSSASASTTAEQADAILSNVAAHVSHGYANRYTSLDEDERIIAAGGHVNVFCGQVTALGHRALDRAGITSRYVGALAASTDGFLDLPAGALESHALLEVWTGSRWTLYDLDNNVQPTDANGGPVTMQQFAGMAVHHYRTIATDVVYVPDGDPAPLYADWVLANHEGWLDRVLDNVAIINDAGTGYYYTGPAQSVLNGMAGYTRVTAQALTAIETQAPPAQVAPEPVAASPAAAAAPAAAVASASMPAPVAKPKPARRRYVTKIRHHKVFHVYGHGRKARWVYVRRASK